MENKQILINFKKAKSHLDKVISMLEQKEYCIDIMQQNLAVIGLLKAANNKLLENHLKSCFANAMKSHNEKLKNQMIDEILKLNKSCNK